MIDETARHAGHPDILREQIDGTVGHRRSPMRYDYGSGPPGTGSSEDETWRRDGSQRSSRNRNVSGNASSCPWNPRRHDGPLASSYPGWPAARGI
ncbi:MAG: DUF664 domain-containing protein [Pseudonocardiaceae bacterium]